MQDSTPSGKAVSGLAGALQSLWKQKEHSLQDLQHLEMQECKFPSQIPLNATAKKNKRIISKNRQNILFLCMYLNIYSAYINTSMIDFNKSDSKEEYQLNFDTLEINVIQAEEVNMSEVLLHKQASDSSVNSGAKENYELKHCSNLLRYIIKCKNSKRKFTAMLDSGSAVTAISANAASNFKMQTSILFIPHIIWQDWLIN